MATFLLGAASEVQSQFTSLFKEVDSSNIVFKLFSKASFGLCFLGSLIVMASEYIGEPIKCEHGTGKVDEGLFTTYCWIHGSKHIAEEYQEHFECRANVSDDDTKDTIYYQWVVFMLAINGIIFKIPHIVWRLLEGGIMKEFHAGKNVKSKLGDHNETDLEFHVKSFEKVKGTRNLKYYVGFQICQVLNLLMLIINWWATDQFLSGNFHTYGAEVVDFYQKDSYVRGKTPDPMCNAFPTVVGCKMQTVGQAGGEVFTTGICILSQNIINEKVYLFLWFWFVFLYVCVSIQLLFELVTLALPAFRGVIIAQYTGTYTGQMKRYLQHKCNVGDWFVLYQIGKNTNRTFFYNLIESLSEESENPKRNGDVERPSAKLIGNEALNYNDTLEMDEQV